MSQRSQPGRYKQQANRIIKVQIGVVLAIALAWCLDGLWAGFSALLGGVIVVAPNYYFLLRFFKTTGASQAKQILRNFYVGEMVKLGLIALLAMLVMGLVAVKMLAFVIGMLAAVICFSFAPLMMLSNNDQGEFK